MDRKLLFHLLAVLALLNASCRKGIEESTVSGTIETDESHVASRYGGRVEKVLAREGATLTNGQTIVELNAAELRAQHDEAAALLAELKAGARPEELAAAKHAWEAEAADLELARKEAKRARELFESHTISSAERDRAVSRAEMVEKTVAAARSRYDLLLAGTRPEQIAQARARLDAIVSRVAEMTIAAPTNAVLEVLAVKIGDVLAPNQAVATLLLPQHLWVRVYVPETWLGYIQPGQTVTVKVDSFPDQRFRGEVEQISREAEFTPRNTQTVAERIKQVFGVKIRLPNDDGRLRAGMAADVYFPDVPKKPD